MCVTSYFASSNFFFFHSKIQNLFGFFYLELHIRGKLNSDLKSVSVYMHASVDGSLMRLSLISRGVGSRYCMYYYFMQF